jgi:chromatin assembly factor 1 subunit B
MKVKTIQILWHNKQPIYSADFEPVSSRLATGGADSAIRIWRIGADDVSPIHFLSTLKRHAAPVNCVRWAPFGSIIFLKIGQILASGGDGSFKIKSIDGTILLWAKSENLELDEDGSIESWKIITSLRYFFI